MMRLRNKKTGKTIDLEQWRLEYYKDSGCIIITNDRNQNEQFCYTTFANMKNDWEDYVPTEPLIKDDKIRKIVRALFDVWEVEDVKIDSNKYFLVTTIEAIGKGWKLEIPSININGVFKPTELCGEEEE